jgi:hypothetical protein
MMEKLENFLNFHRDRLMPICYRYSIRLFNGCFHEKLRYKFQT